MTNEKVVSNFVVHENHYDIFPLAATFGTPHIKGMANRGYQIWLPGENVIMIFVELNIPHNFLIGHHLQ